MTAAPSSAARELDQDAPTDTTRMIFCVSTGSEAAFLRGLGLAAGTADIDKLDAFRGILAAVVPQDESAAAVNKAAGFAIRLRDSAAKIVRSPWTIYDFKAAADEELDLADFLAEIGRNDFPEWTPQDAEQEIKNAEEFSRALAAGDEPEPWEPPIPLVGAAELPAFPVEDLPPLVRGFVSSVAKSRQTPVDLPGVLALGILSGGVARKFIVKIGDTHTDPTNIYTCVGMNTGERKSPVFDDMAGPYEEYERETAKGKRASLLVLAERRQIQEHRLKALRARAAKDDGPDATKAQEEAETLAASMDDVPHPPRFIVRDSTPEALSQVLETSGGKITVLQPEGGGLFDILAGRYSGKANFDVWLHGYSEEELRIDRKGSPPVFVPRASITAVLTTQPEVIEKLSSIDGARGRGLLARFLYSMPKSNVGYRPYKNLQIDPSERAIYRAAVREILAISDPSKQQNGDDGEPYVLRVEGESLEIYRKFHDRIEEDMREGGPLASVSDWANKLPGSAARIAGVLHVGEHACHAPDFGIIGMNGRTLPRAKIGVIPTTIAGVCHCRGNPKDIPISPDTMTSAWSLALYFMEHAKAAFGIMAAPEGTSLALKILKWIQRNGKPTFTQHEVKRGVQPGRVADLDQPLALLVEHCHIRPLPPRAPTGNRGRPKGQEWEINPSILHAINAGNKP